MKEPTGWKGRGGPVEKQIIISGNDELSVFSPDRLEIVRRVPLEGAGILCAGRGQLFCASQRDEMIWRLDVQTLMPAGLFAGGPGVCDLALSSDGGRLYALCGGADSVLLLDAASGMPLILNRAGLNPMRMALDAVADVLAVAAGERCAVMLFSAVNLNYLREIPMPGPVYDVILEAGTIYALCLSEHMQSLLVMVLSGGQRCIYRIGGMPGILKMHRGKLYILLQGGIYVFEEDALRMAGRVPGCASRMAFINGWRLLRDAHHEAVWARSADSGWRCLCTKANDLIVL